MNLYDQIDPKFDLRMERIVDISPELIWRAWTTPELLMQWFCPRPWTTVECEIDLRPGGLFRTVMQSPEGQKFPNMGCFLEAVPNQRLIWTDAFLPGYRPVKAPESAQDFFLPLCCFWSQVDEVQNMSQLPSTRTRRTERSTPIWDLSKVGLSVSIN